MPRSSKIDKKSFAKTDSKRKTGLKYQDKSPGQTQLVSIFNEIRKLLVTYEKGNMKVRGGLGGQIVLVNEKPVEIAGRKKEELWFASAMIQKGFVGFYFMPVYADEEMKAKIKPELLKCLKGKACFHIKNFDREILSQIKEALRDGYGRWHSRGWI